MRDDGLRIITVTVTVIILAVAYMAFGALSEALRNRRRSKRRNLRQPETSVFSRSNDVCHLALDDYADPTPSSAVQGLSRARAFWSIVAGIGVVLLAALVVVVGAYTR